MRRTLIVAIMLVALVFGVATYATAASDDVVVTARVNPMTSLTVDIPATAFAAPGVGVNPGATYNSLTSPEVTVKSNVPYTYTEDGIIASSDAAIETYLSETGAVNQGTEGNRGVFKKQYTYTLDLTADSVYTDLTADTDYTATFQYTATP